MKKMAFYLLFVQTILFSACSPIPATGGELQTINEPQPFIEVVDQSIVDGSVIVPKVYSNGPGWVVIHSNVASTPGAVIGYAPVVDGENLGVEVIIDPLSTTKVLYAVLYTDAGLVGEFEFPGADEPVFVDDKEVLQSFMVDYSINISDFF
jgi:hypothetical protein